MNVVDAGQSDYTTNKLKAKTITIHDNLHEIACISFM